MRFFGLNTSDTINEEKLKVTISVIVLVLMSIIITIGTVSYLNWQAKIDKMAKDQALAEAMQSSDSAANTDDTIPSASELVNTTSVTPTVVASTTPTEAISPTPSDTTTPYGEDEPTAEPTTVQVTETDYFCTVYAASALNVRSGPGTEYDLVKQLNPGDEIDVIAQTRNGWYKTYNGNYVLASLTTTTAPVVATPVPAAPTAAPTPTPIPAPGTETYYGSCTITFYGPQPRGDGTYSTTTATGTTCSQGRTCAADWSVFPAGTVIHVVNDPLGGDGYYTVEDCGPGVRGSHIDIYADDPYSVSTTTAEIYVVH
ncbi:MAG TPA: SH3 domain-containing protein [Saccharofermentans sp.]|nr:SH3 domain-containing protein [Saccharofermentans sp.]